MVAPLVDHTQVLPYSFDFLNKAVRVNLVAGAGASGGTSQADQTSFAEGVGTFTPVGGVLNDIIGVALTEDQAGVVRLTPYRAFHVNLRDALGNELSVGGGTQYAEDTPAAQSELLTMAGVVRKDTAASLVALDGARTELEVDALGRVWVNGSSVTQPVSIAAVVHVDDNAASLTVDGTVAISNAIIHVDDNGASLTIDAPVGTPVAARLSDGAAFLTTTGGRLSVDASGVPVPVTDNLGSLTVDAPVGTPVAVRLSDGAAFVTVTGGRLVVDASGVPVPITDNNASLTVDAPVGTPVAVRISDGAAFLTTTNGLVVDPTRMAPDVTATGTLTGSAQNVQLVLGRGVGGVAIQVTAIPGSSGISFQASVDGATWVTIMGVNMSTRILESSSSVDGLWIFAAGGFAKIRVLSGAWGAGTATVTIEGSAGTGATILAAQVNNLEVLTDNVGFADGASKVFPAGYIFDEVAGTALTENDGGAARMDSKRALVCGIEDATTRGQRAAVSALGALKVEGGAATDAAVAGNPGLMGARASSVIPTAMSADGDAVPLWADRTGALFIRPRQIITYSAHFRLANATAGKRNLVTAALTANTNKQLLTIYHAVSATKRVTLKYLSLTLMEIATLAGYIEFELTQLDGTTAPATGNPAITPAKHDRADAVAEVTCLALPTTQGSVVNADSGTLGRAIILNEGLTPAAGPVVAPPAQPCKLVLLDMLDVMDVKPPVLRAATAEGWAVNVRSTTAGTVLFIAEAILTEE